MQAVYRNDITMDPSGFVLLADAVPQIVQEIRYYSTYNFIGDRIDGYEEPCALLTKEAARALKAAAGEAMVQGYRLKVFDAYRPVGAVKHFVLWGIEDQDVRMKPYFYPELEKQGRSWTWAAPLTCSVRCPIRTAGTSPTSSMKTGCACGA